MSSSLLVCYLVLFIWYRELHIYIELVTYTLRDMQLFLRFHLTHGLSLYCSMSFSSLFQSLTKFDHFHRSSDVFYLVGWHMWTPFLPCFIMCSFHSIILIEYVWALSHYSFYQNMFIQRHTRHIFTNVVIILCISSTSSVVCRRFVLVLMSLFSLHI